MDYFDHLQEILPDIASELIASYDKEYKRCLRINKKISSVDFQQLFMLEPTNILPNTFFFKHNLKLGNTPFHYGGLFYIQDLSSQMVIDLLPLKGNEIVLDMCAAPGGKAIQCAERLESGIVIANDINHQRATILKQNIERIGVKNCMVLNETPNRLANSLDSFFDRVILDAPCSGEALIRKSDKMKDDWSIDKVIKLTSIQKELIEQAYHLVKDSGYILYSTCSFEFKENEEIVQYLLDKYDCELVTSKRLYPCSFPGEGQFMALIKVHKTNTPIHIKRKKTTTNNLITKWFNDNIIDDSPNIIKVGERYFAPTTLDYDLSFMRVLSDGVELGSIVKEKFIPDYAIGTNYTFKQKIDLSKEQVEQYLKGNVINANTSGYVGLYYLGYQIGFGKVSEFQVKNNLPKGIRL